MEETLEERVKSIGEYLDCNEGELWNEMKQLFITELESLRIKLDKQDEDYYFDEENEDHQNFEEDMENCYCTQGEAYIGGQEVIISQFDSKINRRLKEILNEKIDYR